jgi:hypothetical protein
MTKKIYNSPEEKKKADLERRKIKYNSDPVYRKKIQDENKQRYLENWEERTRKNRERWDKNRPRYNEAQKRRYPAKKDKLKTEVLTHYGNGKLACVCCGTTGLVFLTLDHIHGREANDRGPNKKDGRALCAYVKRNNYPEGFQTLCWNCNSGRQINKGICPHKTGNYDL